MSVHHLPLYREDGRLRSHYVYMLFCRDGGPLYVKCGFTIDPGQRLTGLRVGCPLPAKALGLLEVGPVAAARRIEEALHRLLKPYATTGEWFRFELTNAEHRRAFKEARLRACLEVLGRPGAWVNINVKQLDKHQRQAKSARLACLKRRPWSRRA